jgi:hypothetical protein
MARVSPYKLGDVAAFVYEAAKGLTGPPRPSACVPAGDRLSAKIDPYSVFRMPKRVNAVRLPIDTGRELRSAKSDLTRIAIVVRRSRWRLRNRRE